uniref:Distal membrane-arm assembly complex protein 1-like domain-containing protein n=1 Tax=Hucho hucho TaxID=62062 RepID=A0A4W5R693_9TELE
TSTPEPGSAPPGPVSPAAGQMFWSCWSCRILSGGGLLLGPLYVFLAARKVMRQGGTTSMGNVAQIAFAASLAAWGIVVITDPVGKSHRKT